MPQPRGQEDHVQGTEKGVEQWLLHFWPFPTKRDIF